MNRCVYVQRYCIERFLVLLGPTTLCYNVSVYNGSLLVNILVGSMEFFAEKNGVFVSNIKYKESKIFLEIYPLF